MTTILRSNEMNCPSCVQNIETYLGKMEGVSKAKVYFSTGRIEVEYDNSKISDKKLMDAVRKMGYESEVSAF